MSLERWGWCSLALSVLLAAVHGAIAATSGSLAVTAELIHNLGDLLAAAAVLLGLRLASRRSRSFPYGLYKVENLVAAGLAGMIFVSAYEIARTALFAPGAPVQADGWMLAALVATTVLPLAFSRAELRAGRAANSPALIADAKEYRVHFLTTGLVFGALLSEWAGAPLDRIAALFIVVAVVKTGWDLLRDAMRVLLDVSLDGEALGRVRECIHGDPAVVDVPWITGRSAGRFRFVEAGVALRVAELGKAEAAVRRIEASVRASVPHVERVLLHVEAPASPNVRHALPLADPAGTLSEHFGGAPLFAIVTVRRADGGIEEQRVLPNPHQTAEKAKGIRVAEWLVEQKVDAVWVREDLHAKGPEYVLRDAGIDVRTTDRRTLGEALKRVQHPFCESRAKGPSRADLGPQDSLHDERDR